MAFTATKEYQTRRFQDEKIERGMRELLEQIYTVHQMKPVYNTVENADVPSKEAEKWVREREKRGCDVEFFKGTDKHIIADEKAYISKQNAYEEAKSYAFEVSTQNNKNGQGWLFKSDSMNSHYFLIYPQKDISGAMRKVEILCLKRDVLLEELNKAGIGSREKVEKYLEENGSWGNDNRLRAQVNDDMRIVHTGASVLQEQPTNIVISREWLRQHADMVIDVPDVELVQKQYREMQQEEHKKRAPAKILQRPTQQRGIHFRPQAQDVFQKAGKAIPKLRGSKLPEFLEAGFMQADLGSNVNIRISEYAVSGKTVVLKGVTGQEVYDKPICIICGNNQNISLNNLTFKDIPLRQQFTFSAEMCNKVGDKYETKEPDKERENNKAALSTDELSH